MQYPLHHDVAAEAWDHASCMAHSHKHMVSECYDFAQLNADALVPPDPGAQGRLSRNNRGAFLGMQNGAIS